MVVYLWVVEFLKYYCVMFCLLQINEKARSGLSVVPEKESQTQDSDTETEENIKERIEGLMKQK